MRVAAGHFGEANPPTMEATSNRKPLGRLIGAFKTVSSKRINETRGTPGVPVWQRNYYERVIRSDAELDKFRMYILHNPYRWSEDEEYPITQTRG